MKAMILAAGRGERMMPLTLNTPKPLLTVQGKPLLQYHIERLKNAGMTQIVINHCYLGEQIVNYFGDGSKLGVKIQWSAETKALETAGGIRQALPLLGKAPFLVINSDIWTEYPYEKLLKSPYLGPLEKKQTLAHLVLVKNPQQNALGDFGLINNNITNKAETMWTFSGIAVYDPAFIEKCQLGNAMSLTPLLRDAANASRISGEIYTGEWHDIGTPERLTLLEKNLKNQK
ncbi:N-acetylmuramate alpha-1-phosphate uridylyltransferase MurU [Aliikangiella sp. IMCC44359]|uniref:N-acetylmuramate alpha-1-phosphate uridylyltransferase MurU n=1 Tax=Aliikangiella sp. IMCC44359 TaxID=3459125 RepID=UPI00403ACD92